MQRGARYFLWDNMLSMAAFWASAGTVVAGLTGYYRLPLTLSNVIVGLTATLPFLQLLGGRLYRRAARPKAFLYSLNTAWRLLLPAVYLTALLPWAVGRVVGVVLYVAGVSIFELCCPAQTAWMVDSVGDSVPPNYYALREMFFMVVYCGAFAGANLLLAWGRAAGRERVSFASIGTMLALLLGASVVTLFHLPAPPQPKAHTGQPSLLSILRHRPFVRVMLLNMSWSFLGMFIGSYSSLYQVQVIHMDFLRLLVWVSLGNVLRAMATPLIGRLGLHIRWERIIGGCIVWYGLCGAAWACLNAQNASWVYPLAAMGSCLPFAATGVGFLQLQIETTTAETRTSGFAVSAGANALASLTGGSLCSALIAFVQSRGLDLRLPFAVGTALSAALTLGLFAAGRLRSSKN